MKFLPKFKNNPKGFTLVELLVVVSIIAILSVIGLTLFSGVQKNARDAKRRGDVDAIAKALETHYNSETGKYDAFSGTWFSGSTTPTDPNGSSYIGIPSASWTTFVICASLEGANGNASGYSGNTSINGASGAAATYYCIKNRQ